VIWAITLILCYQLRCIVIEIRLPLHNSYIIVPEQQPRGPSACLSGILSLRNVLSSPYRIIVRTEAFLQRMPGYLRIYHNQVSEHVISDKMSIRFMNIVRGPIVTVFVCTQVQRQGRVYAHKCVCECSEY
jgi:hypothetical protein